MKTTRPHLLGNKYRVGKIPWNKGKKGLQVAWNKGKKYSKETCKKISESKTGKSIASKGVPRPHTRGKNNHRWKGGISRSKQGNREYREWRSKIFERDNWTCQTCGDRGCYIESHHIKSWAEFPDLRYDLDNGVTLCRECHKLTDNYKGKNNGIQQYDSNQEDNQTNQED